MEVEVEVQVEVEVETEAEAEAEAAEVEVAKVEVAEAEAAGQRRTYLEALLRVVHSFQLGEDALAIGSGRQQALAALRAAVERRLERLDDVVRLPHGLAWLGLGLGLG